MCPLPVVPQQREQTGRQHHVAVFAALALLDPDDHTPAVDGAGSEPDGFGDPQTCRVTDGQNHAVLQFVDGREEARHFLLAQHDGQLLRLLARRDVVLDSPETLQCDGVEEPQGGDCDDDRTGCETPVVGQVEQVGANLGWPEMFRRFAKVAGEPANLLDIHALRVQSQVADLHVLDHATTKRAHRQLLCETNSATWRRGIVPQRSPQNSKQQSATVTKPTLSIVGKYIVSNDYREAV